ncbi:antirestriction protein ArdA [Nocardia asteroides]|uniref:antirestriction protein ArdA n=1 Tax=Nocardia asteroides TaxID=1824 RepID=UPI001E3490ED|nr:antirestriction protein ArdA [Nocardia asteroides]UGT64436.1 antirestriction protein ArdA [Nocardia asteroides]
MNRNDSQESEATAGSKNSAGANRGSQPKPEPKIYVADLAAYNNGELRGVWLDAARDASAIYDDIHAMLAASPQNVYGGSVAEEFAIHDHEQFGNCRIGEYASIERVSKLARGIALYGYAYAAWADVHEEEPELFDHFPRAYIGQYESLEAYAQYGLDEREAERQLATLLAGSDLADLAGYITIDVPALARDMHDGGDITAHRAPPEHGGGVWLFNERP